MNRHGNFAVSWSGAGPESDGGGIYTRLFDADGAAQTSETRVSPIDAARSEGNPATAMDRWGNFVVSWDSSQINPVPAIGSHWMVHAQLFDSSGRALGGPLLASASETLPAFNGGVGLSDKGDLLLAWSRGGLDAPDSWGVFARRFDVGLPKGYDELDHGHDEEDDDE